jgi:hypothetical protein
MTLSNDIFCATLKHACPKFINDLKISRSLRISCGSQSYPCQSSPWEQDPVNATLDSFLRIHNANKIFKEGRFSEREWEIGREDGNRYTRRREAKCIGYRMTSWSPDNLKWLVLLAFSSIPVINILTSNPVKFLRMLDGLGGKSQNLDTWNPELVDNPEIVYSSLHGVSSHLCPSRPASRMLFLAECL